jgi:hypothetical protein
MARRPAAKLARAKRGYAVISLDFPQLAAVSFIHGIYVIEVHNKRGLAQKLLHFQYDKECINLIGGRLFNLAQLYDIPRRRRDKVGIFLKAF